MNIWVWFGLGVWITGGLYTFRVVAGKVAWMYGHYPDADNIAGGFLVGLVAAVFWPIALPVPLLKDKGPALGHFLVEKVFSAPYPRHELKSHRR